MFLWNKDLDNILRESEFVGGWKMSTSRLRESDPVQRVLSTPLNRKPSSHQDSLVTPSSSLISSPLVKWESPRHYNLRPHHHQSGYTPKWSSTPLLVHNSSSLAVHRASSSPSVMGSNGQENNLLDFEKRLQGLEDKEENERDSGFESRFEESVDSSRTEELSNVPEVAPTNPTPSEPSLGVVPKRRSPRFKQKPVTDRLRSGGRMRREEAAVPTSVLTTVKRNFQGGKEALDIVRILNEMSLSHLIFQFLSSKDLCRVVQVSRGWRLALEASPAQNGRRLALISQMKTERENVGAELQLKNRRISPRRMMQDVANIRYKVSPTAAKRDRTRSSSILVSPSKVRHKLFVDEASKLTAGERLTKCPVCSSPSRVSPPARAVCSSARCQFVFCPECSSAEHPGKPCRPVRPGARLPKSGGIASKKSKERLKRL